MSGDEMSKLRSTNQVTSKRKKEHDYNRKPEAS
jgi:hypothetical protein